MIDNMISMQDRFRGCLLGLAVGDAIGTTVEFYPRGSFAPLSDMIGGGPFKLKAGQWTDDTSMALCLATSLVERKGFDPVDQMERYCLWFDEGYLSSVGRCFDIGITTSYALKSFRKTGNPFAGPTKTQTAGNGCIMRLAPIPMFFLANINTAEHFAAESSRTTHGAAECLDACRLFARITARALLGRSKEDVVLSDRASFIGSPKIEAIARGDYASKSQSAIRGSGYVVDCLEAALWCFINTDNFKDAVLWAAYLGEDADTTAAVCGQIAGAHYGEAGIPSTWLEKITMYQEIRQLSDRLLSHAIRPEPPYT